MKTRVGILAIGDELLNGAVINSNAASIGNELLDLGIVPMESVMIPDTQETIVAHVQRMAPTLDFLMISGGLGPTADDLTVASVACAVGSEVVFDEATADELRQRWASHFHADLPRNNLKQAEKIVISAWIPNPNGTAKGQHLHYAGCTIFLLPGPPRELFPMLHNDVIPYLRHAVENPMYAHRMVVYTVPESKVELRTYSALESLDHHNDLHLAWCAQTSTVRIFVSGDNEALVNAAVPLLKAEFGACAFDDVLPVELTRLLRSRKIKMSVAESCTGGFIGKEMTDLAGASDVFWGGVMVYDNEAKMRLLEVPASILETDGAVSERCCEAMCVGLRALSKADCGIAVTGIAGPGGGTDDKPVGTVFIGTYCGADVTVRRYAFYGNRERVRYATVVNALFQLYTMVRAH